jgi:two-component system sensor histidine kinase TctE
MRTKPRSLRRQLLTWLLVLLIPLLIVGAVNSYYRAYHFSNLAYDRSLFRAALALADQVVVVRGQVLMDLPQTALDLLEYDKDDWVYYRVTDPQGKTVTGEANLPLPPTPLTPGSHLYYDAVLGDKEVRIAAFSLPLEGTSAKGAALIQVAETKSKRIQLADEIIAAMMWPQVVIVLLAGFMVHYGVRRGLASLDKLQHAIEQRSHRDLSAMPIEDSPREVQPLLRAMNDLLRRVRANIDQQQRFTADASHQLRTPLAGLQTQAEMALRESDPERIRHALEWIQAGTVRLSHLVSQLLALARVEPGSGREAAWQSLDLVKLARETTAEWVLVGLERHIDLGFEAPPSSVLINGNEVMMREMLSNLVDNAIRYTPEHGKVTVAVAAEGGQALLSVEDNGQGIPASERERVFERFHRLPESGGDGCGLGLAIVREIALAHHAKIEVEDGPGGVGTRIVVSLPGFPEGSSNGPKIA